MSEDVHLLTEDQIIDLVALLRCRGIGDALGYLLIMTWYAMQGQTVYVDWAGLGELDRAFDRINAERGRAETE